MLRTAQSWNVWLSQNMNFIRDQVVTGELQKSLCQISSCYKGQIVNMLNLTCICRLHLFWCGRSLQSNSHKNQTLTLSHLIQSTVSFHQLIQSHCCWNAIQGKKKELRHLVPEDQGHLELISNTFLVKHKNVGEGWWVWRNCWNEYHCN